MSFRETEGCKGGMQQVKRAALKRRRGACVNKATRVCATRWWAKATYLTHSRFSESGAVLTSEVQVFDLHSHFTVSVNFV